MFLLTGLLLGLLKVFKSKFYTNKFNENTNLFNARKLFKGGAAAENHKNRDSQKEKLGVIKEENSDNDNENIRFRASCATTSEYRMSDMGETYERGSYAQGSNLDGERMQGLLRKNHQDRKTGDEPEILSAFSQDKSEDYLIQPRQFIKPNFGDAREKRIDYYRQKEQAIFGYSEKDSQYPQFTKPKKKKNIKGESGVQNMKIKFDFMEGDSEMDEEDPYEDKEVPIDNNLGRQTLDLNGPIYDPKFMNRDQDGCISEIGYAESEADDVNKILDQMESQSFKGF